MTRELDWGSMNVGGNKENAKFMKLQPGDNRVRIAGKPVVVDIHWEKGLDGSNKKVICPGPGCPVCKAGNSPQTRYQVLVLDRADNDVKVLEGGPRIFGSIRDYAMDKDYGDPTKYDLKIKKEGTGRETKYTVMASPKQSEMTSEEKEKLNNSGDLLELNKPKSIDEIHQMGLEILAGSIADLDDDFNIPGGSASTDSGINDDDWNDL